MSGILRHVSRITHHASRFTLRFRKLLLLIVASILGLSLMMPASQGAGQVPPTVPFKGGTSRVSTASDEALSKVDPDLLRQARQLPSDAALKVIVVSDGPFAAPSGIDQVAAGHSDPNGLTFTAAEVNPGLLPRLASETNVIAVMSNAPLPILPLPEPALARQLRPR